MPYLPVLSEPGAQLISFPPTIYPPPPTLDNPIGTSPYPPSGDLNFQAPIPHREIQALNASIYTISHLPKMADPISLLVSILAISEAAVKISKTLYKLSTAMRGCAHEIDGLILELDTFAVVLDELHDWLDEHKTQISPKGLKSANKILESCKGIFANIRDMMGKTDGQSPPTFWQRASWSFRREKVIPMRANLEAFKQTLSILLHVLQLAQCKTQDKTSSSKNTVARKEKKLTRRVERDIRSQSMALNRWQQSEHQQQVQLSVQYIPKALTWTPLHDSQWLKRLMPTSEHVTLLGKPYLALPAIPDSQSGEEETEQRLIKKTVDVFLSKWTNLNIEANQAPVETAPYVEDTVTQNAVPSLEEKGKPIDQATLRYPADNVDIVGQQHIGAKVKDATSIDVHTEEPGPDTDRVHTIYSEPTIESQSERHHSYTHIDITHVRSPSPSASSIGTEYEEPLNHRVHGAPPEISPHYSIIQPASQSGSSSHQREFQIIYPNELNTVSSDKPYPRLRQDRDRYSRPRASTDTSRIDDTEQFAPVPDARSPYTPAHEHVVTPDKGSYYTHPPAPHYHYPVPIPYHVQPQPVLQNPNLGYPALNTSHYHSHVSSPYGPNYMPPWTPGANTQHASIQPSTNPYPISGPDQYYGEQIPLLPRSRDASVPTPPSHTSYRDLSSDTESVTTGPRKGANQTPKQAKARSHTSSGDYTGHSHLRRTEIYGPTSLDTGSDGVIHYINELGEKFEFPLSKCISWEGLESLVREAYHTTSGTKSYFAIEDHTFVDSNGTTILPSLWEHRAIPGLTVYLRPKKAGAGLTPRSNPLSTSEARAEHIINTQSVEHGPLQLTPDRLSKISDTTHKIQDQKHQSGGNGEDALNVRDYLQADTPPPAVRLEEARSSSAVDREDASTAPLSDVDSDEGVSAGSGDGRNFADGGFPNLLAPFWENIEPQLKEALKAEQCLTGMRLRRRHANIMMSESKLEYKQRGERDPDFSTAPDGKQKPGPRAMKPENQSEQPAQSGHSNVESGRRIEYALDSPYGVTSDSVIQSPRERWLSSPKYPHPEGSVTFNSHMPPMTPSVLSTPNTSAPYEAFPLRPYPSAHTGQQAHGDAGRLQLTRPVVANASLEHKITWLISLLERQEQDQQPPEFAMTHAPDELYGVRSVENQLQSHRRPQAHPHQRPVPEAGFSTAPTGPLVPKVDTASLSPSVSSPRVSSIGVAGSAGESTRRRGFRRRLLGVPWTGQEADDFDPL